MVFEISIYGLDSIVILKYLDRLIKDSEGYDVIEDIEDEAERAEVQNAVKEILSSITSL